MSETSPSVLILAAGQGKRMRSSLPKVLHTVAGEPMLFRILDAILEAQPTARVGLVVGVGKEQVIEAVRGVERYQRLSLSFIEQKEQLGTGHAARVAMESEWGAEAVKAHSTVTVFPGDLPLIGVDLVRSLLGFSLSKSGSTVHILTTELPVPTGYGRILRDTKGEIIGIREERDTTPEERVIREVACSIYSFEPAFLLQSLRNLKTENAQKEYYLTDVLSEARKEGKQITSLQWLHWEDLRGVNNLWELSEVARILNERILRQHALEGGVYFEDPKTTWVSPHAKLGVGVRVGAGVRLEGATEVASGAVIEDQVHLRDALIGERVHLKAGTVIVESQVQADAILGPYAHLRPGSVVGEKSKIGNFVELKKTQVGEKTSIAHLSYLGDAFVGDRVNIGCGFITCNFDGRVIDGKRKHETIIEDDAFIGSDCQAIAPIKIGRGAYIASGSTLTDEVEGDALAIARSRQVTKPGYARKLRGDSK